ncbi:MAG: helix-turn-helix domain-containing protein [Gammaproteobacteria bacterium]
MQDSNTMDEDPAGVTEGPGSRLCAAREARAVSVEQAAAELRLDREIIEALEAEDFEALGAPVFVKGYLRSYGRLLGLDPEEMVDLYRSIAPSDEQPPIVAEQGDFSEGANIVTWSFWALVAVAFLIVLIYVLSGNEGDNVVVESESSALIEAEEPEPELTATDSELVGPAPEAVTDEIAIAPEQEEIVLQPEPEVSAQEVPEQVEVASLRLVITFDEDSWVEISDANRRLLFGLQKEGDSKTLVGKPPCNVHLGNKNGVESTLNGADFSLPAGRRGRNTLRFSITAEEAGGGG